MSNNENNNLLSFTVQSKKIHLIYNKIIAVASLDKEYKESEIENIEQYYTKTTNRYLKALKTYHTQKTLKNPIDPALENSFNIS